MIIKKLITVLANVLVCLTVSNMPAFGKGHDNEPLLKAVFIYNFAKFTRWPDAIWPKAGSSLKLCTIGSNDVTRSMSQLSGKTLRDRTVKVQSINNLDEAQGCHLLYIAEQGDFRPKEVANQICCSPVLTISESPEFSQSGGMIEIFEKEGKIRFHVNLGKVRNAELDINSRLLSLSETVIP